MSLRRTPFSGGQIDSVASLASRCRTSTRPSKELAYVFDVLGLDGVVLFTNANGVYLGNPALAPVLTEASTGSSSSLGSR